MTEYRSGRGRIFFGVILVAIGVLYLLDRFQMLDFGKVMSTYWPVIIILFGLSVLLGSRFRNILVGSLIILLGLLFQLTKLEILQGSAWHYLWPVLIILAGIWILFRPSVKMTREGFKTLSDDELDISALFTAIKRRIASNVFRGGRISVVMAGVYIDLTEAKLESDKAVLDISALMGGVEIRVPRDWKIIIDASPIMGGVEDKTSQCPPAEAKGTLNLRISAVMGGVEIMN